MGPDIFDDGLGWLFSTDDHIIETPELYRSRVPARLRDRAPRLESSAEDEYWVVDGERVEGTGLEAAAGRPPETFSTKAVRFEDMAPACYDARARLELMDVEGIGVEVLFPASLTHVCGARWVRHEDRDFALAAVRAYNDWAFEEWHAVAPDRFLPAIILPLWDVPAAVAETERMAARGAKAVSFSSGLHHLGLPHLNDRRWDPLWDAFVGTGMVVCNHIEGVDRALHRGASAFGHEFEQLPEQAMAPFASLSATNAMAAVADYVFSPVFRRHPELQFVISEGGIGWVPYMLQKVRHVWTRHRAWAGPLDDIDPVAIFRQNLSVCFIDDAVGIELRDWIGLDRIMWESDYPHTDCNFPRSRAALRNQLEGLEAPHVAAVCRGNAERIFRHRLDEEALRCGGEQ